MLGHQFPECTRALHSNESATALKTRIMVLPNQAERLCARSPCDYAAMKHFFSYHLWQSVVTGPLRGDINVALGRQYEAIRSAFQPVKGAPRSSPDDDGLPPYIGVHLRHKWEFKLTPPRVSQVAEVLRSIVVQLDPTQHTELRSAAPAPNGGRHAVWGERPVVFCASDEVRTSPCSEKAACSHSLLRQSQGLCLCCSHRRKVVSSSRQYWPRMVSLCCFLTMRKQW